MLMKYIIIIAALLVSAMCKAEGFQSPQEKNEYQEVVINPKREFRGGKPAGDKRGQRAQRFAGSKPGFNKGRAGKKREE